jgi:hypothetical protein
MTLGRNPTQIEMLGQNEHVHHAFVSRSTHFGPETGANPRSWIAQATDHPVRAMHGRLGSFGMSG